MERECVLRTRTKEAGRLPMTREDRMLRFSTRRGALQLTAAVVAALTIGAALPSALRAQDDYPSRPINVIVPFATGGYNDRLARAFAPYLEKELGQPLNIINQEGAGAQLGHTYAL